MKQKFVELRDLLFSAAVLADEISRGLPADPAPETLPLSSLKIIPDHYYGQGETAALLKIASSTLASLARVEDCIFHPGKACRFKNC